MSTLQTLESGSRHDLRVGKSPDAPDESLFKDDSEGAFGYCHSYETSSRYDGPGVRVVLFVLPAACCDARIATTRTHGISRTAPMSLRSRCSIVSRVLRLPSRRLTAA